MTDRTDAEPTEPPARRRRGLPRLWVATMAVWSVTVIAGLVVAFLPSGYLVDSPGQA
ncbi:MAG: hypothetical protein JST73_08110, partial [Actinobacteria bacterium]|nr:hypothetical protein [Actinomycetota bacterium]